MCIFFWLSLLSCAMEFQCLSFSELSSDELYEIIALRVAIFVVEQDCPYQDLDGKDQKALHCVARKDGELVAYTRLLPQGLQYEQYAAIGRVVTAQSVRGQGAGKKIMTYSIEQCQAHFPNQAIKISAQSHLDKFYGGLGFQSTGDNYLEDGIPHQAMILQR